jgi:hypothetical protein
MGNSIEQITAGVLIFGSLCACIAAVIGLIAVCDRIKAWLCGVPHVSMKQRKRIRAWQHRQLIKHRYDSAFIPLMEPTESELEQEEVEIAAESAARERQQIAKQEAAQSAPPEIAPQDIIFEDGKAIIRPHARMSVAVSTMRLTFQDGSEWDISADIEFAGLSEEDFRAAYDAFLNTQAELGGLKGSPPPLNSKFGRERGV